MGTTTALNLLEGSDLHHVQAFGCRSFRCRGFCRARGRCRCLLRLRLLRLPGLRQRLPQLAGRERTRLLLHLLPMPMLPTSMADTTAIPTTEDTDTDTTVLDTTVSVLLDTPDTPPPMSPGPSRDSAVNAVKLRPMPMLTMATMVMAMAILMAVDTTVVDTMVDMVTDTDTDTDTMDRF